jgi:hypothetical protein
MEESLQLFGEVIHERCFNKKNIIIFYNKEDVFKKKITQVDLNVCFDEYKEGKKYEPALKFIQKKYTSLNQNKKRNITGYLTNATDTKIVSNVFKTVHSILLKGVLDDQSLT